MSMLMLTACDGVLRLRAGLLRGTRRLALVFLSRENVVGFSRGVDAALLRLLLQFRCVCRCTPGVAGA
jgi:hypothetical protein